MSANQRSYRIRFEWGLPGILEVANHCALTVIVDVLCSSTCVDIATSRGAVVYPQPFEEPAPAGATTMRKAMLPGTRSRDRHSPSPASLLDIAPGCRLVLPSPNGAALALACRSPHVVTGCLRNARSVAAYSDAASGPVCVIAAGEKWSHDEPRFALEDLLGAGAIIHRLSGPRSPEAQAAESVYLAYRSNLFGALSACTSGAKLKDEGSLHDVLLAAELNVSDCVPIFLEGCFENWQG